MGMGFRIGAARHLQTSFDAGGIGAIGDGELLARFLRRDDLAETAFAALVHRLCADGPPRLQGRPRRRTRGAGRRPGDLLHPLAPQGRRDPQSRRPAVLAPRHGTASRHAGLAIDLTTTARTAFGGDCRNAVRGRRIGPRMARMARGIVPASGPLPRADHPLRPQWPDPDGEAAEKAGCPARTLQTRLYRRRNGQGSARPPRGRTRGGLRRRGLGIGRRQAAMPPSWAAATAGAASLLAGAREWAAAGDQVGQRGSSVAKSPPGDGHVPVEVGPPRPAS